MPVPASAQVRTCAPDGSDRRWLSRSGHVVSQQWSFELPGGAKDFSCVLQAPVDARPPGLQAGRQVQVFADAGAPIWDGQLDEPSPGQDGWQITAHGAGLFGNQFLAHWTANWSAGDASAPGDAVSQAIGKGLRWVDGGDLDPQPPSGAWMGQAPDNGMQYVADILNLLCSRGGLTWTVTTGPGGNVLRVIPLPTQVTRLIVATRPVARTIAEVVTACCIRYCSKDDDPGTAGEPAGSAATYTTTWVPDDLPAGADKTRLLALAGEYGRTEKPLDLSDAGLTGSASARRDAAQAIGVKALMRYTQAAFAGPYEVHQGEYLTVAGAPVVLATETAGEVARVLLSDYAGAVDDGLPVTFPVGAYAYDEETGAAQVTPLQSVRMDWASLVSSLTAYRTKADDPFGVKAGG